VLWKKTTAGVLDVRGGGLNVDALSRQSKAGLAGEMRAHTASLARTKLADAESLAGWWTRMSTRRLMTLATTR
jgi:hypothetical protein